MASIVQIFADLLKSIFPVFIIFGGAVPYVPQYLEIKKRKNSSGFSTFVCLVVHISNILRLEFWFGQPYPTPLLLQAILMNAVMLFMLYVCIAYRTAHTDEDSEDQNQVNRLSKNQLLNWRQFWQWTDFSSYVKFLLIFVLFTGSVTFLFSSSNVFVQSLGFIALFLEAMLGVPQFIENHRKGSTVGMSLKMVLLWTIGDTMKTVYFVYSKAPLQFLMCGSLQIGIDLAIFGQYFYYSR